MHQLTRKVHGKHTLLKISPAKEHLRLPTESWFVQHEHTFPSFPLHTLYYFSSLLCGLLCRGISTPGLSKTLCDTSLKKRLAHLPCFHTPFWADAINYFWTQDAGPQKPFTSCPDLRLNFSSLQRRVAVRFPRCRLVSIWVAFLYTPLGRCSASATRVTSSDRSDTAARATSCPWDPPWGQDQPWDPAGAATLPRHLAALPAPAKGPQVSAFLNPVETFAEERSEVPTSLLFIALFPPSLLRQKRWQRKYKLLPHITLVYLKVLIPSKGGGFSTFQEFHC